MRSQLLHANLHQRRRDQRGKQNIDARGRHAHPEDDARDGGDDQQQHYIAAAEMDQEEGQRETEPGDVEYPDHEAGGTQNQQQVHRNSAGLDERFNQLPRPQSCAFVGKHHAEHDDCAGGPYRRFLRGAQEFEQNVEQQCERNDEMPAMF